MEVKDSMASIVLRDHHSFHLRYLATSLRMNGLWRTRTVALLLVFSLEHGFSPVLS
jgi:hypothetical protein